MKNKNNFKIRKASLKDLDDILALNFKLFKKEYKEYDNDLDCSWTYKFGKKVFRDKIKNPRMFLCVAEFNSKIVGYLSGKIKDKDYAYKSKYGRLDSIFVDNKFRSRGAGFLLANEFKKWCEKKGVSFINVTSEAKNNLAHKFYKRIGFKHKAIIFKIKIKNEKNRN